MIQAVDATQFVFPQGMETELAQRGQAMLDEAEGKLWIRRGKSTYEEQLAYWEPWSKALKFLGYKEAIKQCEIASFPGTSRHEENPAKALDIMCAEIDEVYRDHLAKKHGLHAPIELSPYHFELDPNRRDAQKLNKKRTYTCALPTCENTIERYASTVRDETTICCSKSCARYLTEMRRHDH